MHFSRQLPRADQHATREDTFLVPPAAAARPFVLRLSQRGEQTKDTFVPTASVEITPALRTSGLLAELPAEELKSLLGILTFVTPSGDILPTLSELAEALRLPYAKTHRRLQRLEQVTWDGEPIVFLHERASGLHAWTPAPRLVTTVHDAEPAVSTDAPLQVAGREAVLRHSRTIHARPREEVEAEIAFLNGWAYPFVSLAEAARTAAQAGAEPALEPVPGGREPALRARLLALGVTQEQADMLQSRFSSAQITQQVAWLPQRHPRNPAALLLAALEHAYGPPHAAEASAAQP